MENARNNSVTRYIRKMIKRGCEFCVTDCVTLSLSSVLCMTLRGQFLYKSFFLLGNQIGKSSLNNQ